MSDEASSIRIEQPVMAPRQLVWDACTTLAGLMRWQADDASGDVQPGSQLVLRYPAFGAEVKLDVTEVVPEERLVLKTDHSVVEFQFAEGGVVLVHRGLDVRADRKGITSSWRLSLALLAHSVERHPLKSRTVCWATRTVPASPELVHLCFTEKHCLSQWLGQGEIGAEGSLYKINAADALQLSGRVWVNEQGRDIALSCDNLDDSMLILRTLPVPNSAEDRTVALAWSNWGEPETTWLLPTIEAFETAVDNLQAFLKRTVRD